MSYGTTENVPTHVPDGWFEKYGKRGRGEFLKGPVPLEWLLSALDLGATESRMALAIWFLAGLCGNLKGIRLRPKTVRRFVPRRQTAYRGLKSLEDAGLISVDRRRGRAAVVNILVKGDSRNGADENN